jgi:glutamate 5-kinase
MAIARGRQPGNILKILDGQDIGTRFDPQPRNENARKRWIAYGLLPMGDLTLDNGAVRAICRGGKSLLAAGIVRVEGEFSASESVRLRDATGREIARGIVNYSSAEIDRVKGQHSDRIAELLGYTGAETIVHRDNLVVLLPSA